MDVDTPALKRIQFVRHKVVPHRRHYATEEDVRIVLSRLPEELWSRLRKVHFKDDARGNRRLGYTTRRARREITLCALPIRVSLNRAEARPEIFGALRGSQWPVLAVRRFMLYDVLLHELGHLQVILPESKNPNRKFASETKAQEFANTWRKKLWSERYDHPDPAHNAPTPDETMALKTGWIASYLAYKRGHLMRRRDPPAEADARRAAELLRRTVEKQPANWIYHYSLAVALLDFPEHHEEAVRHAREALRLNPGDKQASSLLAQLNEAGSASVTPPPAPHSEPPA